MLFCNGCETQRGCKSVGRCQGKKTAGSAEVPEAPTDPVIERVRADLLRRQQLGYRKYGGTLATNPAGLRGALQHAYEEALDLCNYLQWSMMQLDGSSELTPDETHNNTGLKVEPLTTVQRDKLAGQIQHWVENYDPKLLENVSVAALQDELQRRQYVADMTATELDELLRG